MVFICGPSAVGKTAVAVELALLLNGEIISCDAMQVYKEIGIASDKPSARTLAAVKHHLLDVVSVEDEFNVARYRELALQAIGEVRSRHKLPVVCGGSGMYMMALLDGIFNGGEVDRSLRKKLEQEAASNGLMVSYERLRSVDPEAAARIKPNDRQRIVRALEVFEATGVPLSQMQKKRDGLWGKAGIRIFALTRPREELYARAEQRVEEMFGRGLVEEVRLALGKRITPSAARLIGLPEIAGHIEGRYGLEQAKDLMKRNTRRYIKRQLTWFRKDERIEWINVGEGETAEQTAVRITGLLRTNLS